MLQTLFCPVQSVDFYTKIYSGKNVNILIWLYQQSWELSELFSAGDWQHKIVSVLSGTHFPNNGNTRVSYDIQSDSIVCKTNTRGVRNQIILRSNGNYTWYMRSSDVRFENPILRSAKKNSGLDYTSALRKAWRAFMECRIHNFIPSNLGDLTKKDSQTNISLKNFLVDHLNLIESSIIGNEKKFAVDFFVGNKTCRLLFSLEDNTGTIYRNGAWTSPISVNKVLQMAYDLVNPK